MSVPMIRTSERSDFKIPVGRRPGFGFYLTEEARLAARIATRARAQLMHRYGVTVEWFNERYDLQEGRCGICDNQFQRRPDVDHDHRTGEARGLLCRGCNVGLGWAERNYEAVTRWLFP